MHDGCREGQTELRTFLAIAVLRDGWGREPTEVGRRHNISVRSSRGSIDRLEFLSSLVELRYITLR